MNYRYSRTTLILFLVMCWTLSLEIAEAFPCQAVVSRLPRQAATSTSTSLFAVNGEKRHSSDESKNYNYIGLNTNAKAPYVPSGLNPEQYQKIKQDEAAKLAKMNFGAWGPRFKQTDTPDGDWMVQTNLWVKGFQAGSTQQPSTPEELERRAVRQQQFSAVKTALSSFLLGYLVLDVLLLSFDTVRSVSSTKNLLASIIARQGMMKAVRQHFVSSLLTLSKFQILKVALAGLATPVITNYREFANRRYLWSRRRTFGAPIMAAVALVAVKMTLGLGLASVLR